MTEEKRGLDVAIECVGLPEIWERMFKLVRRGGCVHLFGGRATGKNVKIYKRRLYFEERKNVSGF